MNVNPTTLAPHEVRAKFHRLAEERRKARKDFHDAGYAEADAEYAYQTTRASALRRYRKQGIGVTEGEILAKGDGAERARERDKAHVDKRWAEMRIAELEADRANLRHLSEREERES